MKKSKVKPKVPSISPVTPPNKEKESDNDDNLRSGSNGDCWHTNSEVRTIVRPDVRKTGRHKEPPPELPAIKLIPFRFELFDVERPSTSNQTELLDKETTPPKDKKAEPLFLPKSDGIELLNLPIASSSCDVPYLWDTGLLKRKSRISNQSVDDITDRINTIELDDKKVVVKPNSFSSLLKILQYKISRYSAGLKVSFLLENNERIDIIKPKSDLLDSNSDMAEDENSSSKYKLSQPKLLDEWFNSITEIDNVPEVCKKWNKLKTSPQAELEIRVPEIAKLLHTDEETISNFVLIGPKKATFIRNANSGAAIFPDLLKMLAFSFWQKRDYKNCAYFLTAVHGCILKSEILDKQLYSLMLLEEEPNGKDTVKDPKAVKVYTSHIKNLKVFGRGSFSEFMKMSSEINPDWTIIQITSMFEFSNRFSTDAAAPLQTPPLFLTCFGTLFRQKQRAIFTTFIQEPKTNFAVSKTTLTEQFADLMLENRRLNSNECNRSRYWETRREHNSKLTSILAAVEENWLYPWFFMLGGNLMDNDVQTKIFNLINSIETQFKKSLTSSQKLTLSKLISNFNILSPAMKNAVGHLLSYILDDFLFPIKNLANSVIKLGSSIPVDSERHPVIFILDQDIEQIPWEALVCMRQTCATRMQSLSALYGAMKHLQNKPPVDPDDCYFLLNPDGTLGKVEERLNEYFLSRPSWKGTTGKPPEHNILDNILQERSVYLYCGHGDGQAFHPEWFIQKIICNAVPLLMGCGSVRNRFSGPKSFSTSVLNAYIVALCPSVVGFLWEISDAECDRITVELLERWAPAPEGTPLPNILNFDSKNKRDQIQCLAAAVNKARWAATQFLTQAAIVNYGLPVLANNDSKEIIKTLLANKA